MNEIKLETNCGLCYYLKDSHSLQVLSYGKGTQMFRVGLVLENVPNLTYSLADSPNLPRHCLSKEELSYFEDVYAKQCYTINQIRELKLPSAKEVTLWTDDETGYILKDVDCSHIFCGMIEFEMSDKTRVLKHIPGESKYQEMTSDEILFYLKNGNMYSSCKIPQVKTVGIIFS